MRASWPAAPAASTSTRANERAAIGGRFMTRSCAWRLSAGGVPTVEHDQRAGEERGPVAGHVDVEIGDLVGGGDAADGVALPEHVPEGARVARCLGRAVDERRVYGPATDGV